MAKIIGDVRRISRTFDMTQNGLGADLLKAFTDGVKDTIAKEEAPDGTPWDQLDPAYEAWKQKNYPGKPIGFLEEIMADAAQIEGTPRITAEEAETTYGITDVARDHASWFQNGDEDNNQPPRPFWGFTPESLAKIKEILAKRLSESVNG
jgi:phage gpG-like protein